MTADITQWLRTESLPRNVYELLGRPPLDPDRDGMLTALRGAERVATLLRSPPQNGASAAPADRQSDGILGDPETFKLADEAPGTEALPARGRAKAAPEPLPLEAEPVEAEPAEAEPVGKPRA